jgi:hypothetical protein
MSQSGDGAPSEMTMQVVVAIAVLVIIVAAVIIARTASLGLVLQPVATF